MQGLIVQFFATGGPEGEVRTRLDTQVTHSSPLETEIIKQKHRWDPFYLAKDHSNSVRPDCSYFIRQGSFGDQHMSSSLSEESQIFSFSLSLGSQPAFPP